MPIADHEASQPPAPTQPPPGPLRLSRLVAAHPQLAGFLIVNPYGKRSLDFANPEAVKALNRALLKEYYGLRCWDIPDGYLCPPVPGRADYLHYLADLLADGGQVPRGAEVRVLDIGTGANCIYPLIGHGEYGWRFVASDIDARALASARGIVEANRLQQAIEVRQQADAQRIFHGLIEPGERFRLTLCNPPFHTSAAEAHAGSRRKWRNLGKLQPQRQLPLLNFGGQGNELWCAGGELGFLRRMIAESAAYAGQVDWFSSLLSKGGNLEQVRRALRRAGASQVRVIGMAQGNKQSRLVAWRFSE